MACCSANPSPPPMKLSQGGVMKKQKWLLAKAKYTPEMGGFPLTRYSLREQHSGVFLGYMVYIQHSHPLSIIPWVSFVTPPPFMGPTEQHAALCIITIRCTPY